MQTEFQQQVLDAMKVASLRDYFAMSALLRSGGRAYENRVLQQPPDIAFFLRFEANAFGNFSFRDCQQQPPEVRSVNKPVSMLSDAYK